MGTRGRPGRLSPAELLITPRKRSSRTRTVLREGQSEGRRSPVVSCVLARLLYLGKCLHHSSSRVWHHQHLSSHPPSSCDTRHDQCDPRHEQSCGIISNDVKYTISRALHRQQYGKGCHRSCILPEERVLALPGPPLP